MPLAGLVAAGTFLAWLVILGWRWKTGKPLSQTICERAVFVAFEWGGAITGALYPTLWAIGSNTYRAYQSSWTQTKFEIVGHLPPGVEDGDLVAVLFVGTIFILIRGFISYRKYLTDENPHQA